MPHAIMQLIRGKAQTGARTPGQRAQAGRGTAGILLAAGGLMYLLFNIGITLLGAARAGVTFYLQTLFTVILACLLLGERLHPYHVAGITLIAAGILPVTLIKQETGDRS